MLCGCVLESHLRVPDVVPSGRGLMHDHLRLGDSCGALAGVLEHRCDHADGSSVPDCVASRLCMRASYDRWYQASAAADNLRLWLQVSVDGPSRTTVNAAGMKQGAACFQYVAMHPGVYTISATIDGRHINNSPATVTASIAKPCAPNCEVRQAPFLRFRWETCMARSG